MVDYDLIKKMPGAQMDEDRLKDIFGCEKFKRKKKSTGVAKAFVCRKKKLTTTHFIIGEYYSNTHEVTIIYCPICGEREWLVTQKY